MIRARALLLSTLVLALFAGGCGDDKKKKKDKDDDSKGSSSSEAEGSGSTFTSANGKYSVKFPFGLPKESTRQDSKKITWNEAKSEIGAYAISWAEFPDAKDAQASMDDYISTMKNEIQENKEVMVGSAKARELRMKVSDTAMMWLRIFVVDKRVYKVSAGTKNDQPKAMKFLDTFKLTG